METGGDHEGLCFLNGDIGGDHDGLCFSNGDTGGDHRGLCFFLNEDTGGDHKGFCLSNGDTFGDHKGLCFSNGDIGGDHKARLLESAGILPFSCQERHGDDSLGWRQARPTVVGWEGGWGYAVTGQLSDSVRRR